MANNFIPAFHAAQGTLKFSAAAITFDESTLLNLETWPNIVIQVKNINITPPKGETEIVQLLGNETVSVGTAPMAGTWQNSIFDEKAWTEATLTATMILTGDITNVADFTDLVTGTGQTVSTVKRHGFGSTSTNETRDVDGAIMLDLNNGAENLTVVLSNPYVNMGDIKPTGMEGHFEVDFEAKCLPKNFAIDIKT